MERLFECVAAQPAARLFLGQITGGGASWMSMDPVRRILIHPDGHDTFKTIHGRPTARNRPTHTRRPSGGRGAAFSPLYRQIKELLVQSLDRGEWKPGELIPSEIDLAARFQVSQGTVRKAVDELAAEHLLLRRQGKGTFVATHHEARVRYRFLRLAADDEAQAGSGRAESRILECRRLRAPAEIARGLELRAGEAVIMIRRLLCMDTTPTVVDDIWLPGASFRGLTLELLTANKAPMYGLFESEFGVSMVRADEKLRAVAAPAEIAPCLMFPRRAVAAGGPSVLYLW